MKIYLAAIETAKEHGAAVVAARAPAVLTSYYYARKPADARVWEGALRTATLRLADSGAFTIRTAAINKGKAGEGKADADFDAYLAEYVAWLRRMRAARLLDYWVEMDISVAAGYPWVERQRRAYAAAGLDAGLVNVWHSDKDWAYWLYLLDEARRPGRSRYVAIESHQRDRGPLDYARFLAEAYRRGVRVHGFKMTACDDLLRYPFYSVDSTSWIAPSLYGMNFARRPDGTLLGVGKGAHARVRLDRLAHRAPIAARGTYASRLAMLIDSAKAWVKMADDVARTWRGRGVDWDARLTEETTSHV